MITTAELRAQFFDRVAMAVAGYPLTDAARRWAALDEVRQLYPTITTDDAVEAARRAGL